MPRENVFERTMLIAEEEHPNGTKVLKRIPWDFLSHGNSGFFVSPVPVAENMFGDTATTTTVSDVLDLLGDEGQNNLIDEVVRIERFQSEQHFNSLHDHVFSFYSTDNPSRELGYPRS